MAVFSNQATLSYNGNTTNSNIAFGELLDVLAISKTAVETTYSTGDVLTYVVTIRNTGTTAVTGVNLSDNLGGTVFDTGTVYPLTADPDTVRLIIDGVLQPTPTVSAGPPLTVIGLSIPAGASAVLVYQATVNGFANPGTGGTLQNTVTATGGGLTAPIAAAATLTALDEPVLTINKSINPTQVVDNDRVTYTFVIQNTGTSPVTADGDLIITDTFNPILTDLAVTLNGTPFTSYTYTEETGLFSTTSGAITVPAATVTQDPTTGVFTVTPGTTTLTVTGTI